jgi:hypothetical protein
LPTLCAGTRVPVVFKKSSAYKTNRPPLLRWAIEEFVC